LKVSKKVNRTVLRIVHITRDLALVADVGTLVGKWKKR
jgi:hypothetical protein